MEIVIYHILDKVVVLVVIKESIAEQVYTILKNQIVTQETQFGVKLSPRTIAKEHGVSTMPVRDALNRLAGCGLVTVRPRVGYYVKEFNKKDVENIMEVRKMLELHALKEHFAGIDHSVLRQLLAEMESSEKTPERAEFDLMDQKLHDTLIKASQNEYFIANYRQVRDLVVLLQHLNPRRMERAQNEHRELIQAITSNRHQEALQCLSYHLDNVMAAIVAKI